jgi:RNA polymerase sigma factor (sigma-70 family)
VAHDEPAYGTAGDALMIRLAENDKGALAPLYARHAPLAKRALRRFAPECTAAELEELLQDVFVALFESASRYPAGLGVERWLWGIAAKTALHWRRKTWVRRKLLRIQGDPFVGLARAMRTSPEKTVSLRREIARAMSALPAVQRDVLLLHAVEGFSGEEIAEILGIRHETVRTRLFRARKKLVELIPEAALGELMEGSAR